MMGSNSVSPGDVARVRLFTALIAAELVAAAVVILPTWTPVRAAVAGFGLALGIAASLFTAWRLDKGMDWLPGVVGVGVGCAIAQALLSQSDPREPAYVLLGAAALLAVRPLLGPDFMSWITSPGKPPAFVRPLLIAMLVAGFVLPGFASSMHDPTQIGPDGVADSMHLAVTCHAKQTGDLVTATAHVEFSWPRTDLLPHGLTGMAGANDLITIWPEGDIARQQWASLANPSSTTMEPLSMAPELSSWDLSTTVGPIDLTVDGRPPYRGFGRAIGVAQGAASSQSLAQRLDVNWQAVDAGRTFAATWTFQSIPGGPVPFIVIQYDHLHRLLFQAGADCSRPSVAYATQFMVEDYGY
jgi:hypothetical protein